MTTANPLLPGTQALSLRLSTRPAPEGSGDTVLRDVMVPDEGGTPIIEIPS